MATPNTTRNKPATISIILKYLFILVKNPSINPVKTAVSKNGTASPAAYTVKSHIDVAGSCAALNTIAANIGPTHGVHPSAKERPRTKGAKNDLLFTSPKFALCSKFKNLILINPAM